MGYEMCLEKAGAKVHKFKNFGSYQGEWWAFVTFKRKKGWVSGSFGSCSFCDSFEREFDGCYSEEKDLDERYAKFGLSYLNDLMTQKEAEKATDRNREYWCDEDREMFEFIREKHEAKSL